MQRLLAVTTPKRRLIYLTAIYTGLRIGELRQLLGADLHLEGPRPYFLARAGTTKNKKDASIPLHPLLAEEIRKLPIVMAQPVFKIGTHMERSVKRDLIRAKIDLVTRSVASWTSTRCAKPSPPVSFKTELRNGSRRN